MVAMRSESPYIPLMTLADIAKKMAAIGNETRLEVYRLLVRAGDNGLAVTSIQQRLGVPASTLSHHLHKLIQVGLVQQERQGTTLICRADYTAMQQTFEMFASECCADDDTCSFEIKMTTKELMK